MRFAAYAPRSLRAKFLLVMVGGVLLPLALVGFSLARGAERAGETVLRARLESALMPFVAEVGRRWVAVRSELLSEAATQIPRGAAPHSAEPPAEGTIVVSVPVHSPMTGDSVGTYTREVPLSHLVPTETPGAGAVGAVLGVMERSTGRSLLPVPFDPALLESDAFQLAGERWLVSRRILNEPPLILVASAPLEPYTAPLRSVARDGLIALVVVSVAALLVAWLTAKGLTRSLEQLADAADAVALGDLNRTVRTTGGDEVGRVAQAFNSMTARLRQQLREMTRRGSLAAVGEFAASLAHEVRNPLTAIRIDLQRTEEQLPPGSALLAPIGRALREVSRLDRTVSGALRVARGGSVERVPVELEATVIAASDAARPAFAAAGAQLEPLLVESDGARVSGDAAALQQVFLNLLLNAAQALDSDGRAGVRMSAHDGVVEVEVWDDGRGMSPETRARAFDPFYSTKPDGTGLGLAVARQIVAAHGGEITIDSQPLAGTRIRVRLPSLAAV
ncbi:hypothetical protein BH23GEM2_BH23GEM2_20370 [soil metagenome]